MLHHQTRHTLMQGNPARITPLAILNRLQMATISVFSEKGCRLLPTLEIPK
jgi:hypothetical protein